MHATILLNLLIVLGAADGQPAAPPTVEAAVTPPSVEASSTAVQKIALKDGQEIRGRVTSETPDSVVLELLSGGRMELPRASIKKIETEEVTVGRDGEMWFPDPNRTRYLYAPSAMMLRPGECYFSQKELFFSAVGCGLHENVSVLLGTVLPAWFFIPTSGQGMNAIGAIKVGAPIGDVLHLAGGVESLVIPMGGTMMAAGFVFASGTVGNPNAHATLSVGKPFFLSGSSSIAGDALFVVGGDIRLAPNFALVTENWLMPTFTGPGGSSLMMLNSLAVRFLGPRWSADVGLVRLHDWYIPVPWLDVTYNFN
ncbi:MAG TPA: hypothetical protein VFB81_10915 [Myxococcales bacterium]|nr:hypothetical protein [Myxococcales bacterium]